MKERKTFVNDKEKEFLFVIISSIRIIKRKHENRIIGKA